MQLDFSFSLLLSCMAKKFLLNMGADRGPLVASEAFSI